MPEQYQVPDWLYTLIDDIDKEAEVLQVQLEEAKKKLNEVDGKEMKEWDSKFDFQLDILKVTTNLTTILNTLKEWTQDT
jgi:hypothetical protein